MKTILALFDSYTVQSQELLHSLKSADLPLQTVFCQYTGEIPSDSICPFTYYTGLQDHIHNSMCTPLFFNKVPIPKWAEIRQGNHQYAQILVDGYTIGKINYLTDSFRLVESVDWLSRNGLITSRDLYNQCGTKFATTYFTNDQPYQTVYFRLNGNSEGTSQIEVCHRTNFITLRSGMTSSALVPSNNDASNNQQLRHFTSLAHFVSHFIDDLNINDTQTIINSLSHPLFVMRMRSRSPQTSLFWQERLDKEPPGNMDIELKDPIALRQIIFHDYSQLKSITKQYPSTNIKFSYLSHLNRFQEHDNYQSLRTFTLTHTDNLPGLEQILQSFPNLSVCVGALTTMSDKLLQLSQQFPNLHLRPVINRTGIKEELSRASIYLDINEGQHVYDIVKAAYHLNLLVLAIDTHAKEPEYELTVSSINDLLLLLQQATSSIDARSHLMTTLHQITGPQSTSLDYINTLYTS